MKTSKAQSLALGLLLFATAQLQAETATNSSPAETQTVIPKILAQLTTLEKLQLLRSGSPNGVARLGIPDVRYGELLHGCLAPGATAFPQCIGLGATWDPDLIEQMGNCIAKEARAAGTQIVFAPMLGLGQDPRWGRVEESYGEDPYLVSRMGVAYVFGVQGRGAERFDRNHVIACAKHFAADGCPLGGQNGGAMEISERQLRETHLRPFEAVVKEAGLGGIMPAHHELNGMPCHGNQWLLQDVLRKEWGFDGLVVSDFRDIATMADPTRSRVAATPGEAALLALRVGVDVDLNFGAAKWEDPGRAYGKVLADEIQAGRVPMELLDRAAGDCLKARLEIKLEKTKAQNTESSALETKLAQTQDDAGAGDIWGRLVREGQLDANSKDLRADAAKVLGAPEHCALAVKVAEKAMTLLKNDRDLLPLSAACLKKVAVVGPLGETMSLGGYSTPKPKLYISVVDGLKQALGPGVEVGYAAGCELGETNEANLPEAVALAREADVVIAVVGTTRDQMGENLDRDNLDLSGGQERLVEAVQATGNPVVVVLVNGGPLTINWIKDHVPAILEAWYPGQAAGTAVAEALLGKINPGGKLTVTFPQNIGRVPCYYNHLPANRKMNFYNSKADCLFPFGFGLSYTKFSYGELSVTPATIAPGQTATVSVEVTNTGKRIGDEVIQFYLRDDVSSLVRPAKELKGFERVTLAPGETKTVSFPVGFEQLKFWKDGQWVVEPGTFTLMIGSSSEDIRCTRQLIWQTTQSPSQK